MRTNSKSIPALKRFGKGKTFCFEGVRLCVPPIGLLSTSVDGVLVLGGPSVKNIYHIFSEYYKMQISNGMFHIQI